MIYIQLPHRDLVEEVLSRLEQDPHALVLDELELADSSRTMFMIASFFCGVGAGWWWF